PSLYYTCTFSSSPATFSFCLYSYFSSSLNSNLLSFPTRRSSDLHQKSNETTLLDLYHPSDDWPYLLPQTNWQQLQTDLGTVKPISKRHNHPLTVLQQNYLLAYLIMETWTEQLGAIPLLKTSNSYYHRPYLCKNSDPLEA